MRRGLLTLLLAAILSGAVVLVLLATQDDAGPPAVLRPGPVSPDATPLGGFPVVRAAGDIACDPNDRNYNGGAGTAFACRMEDTANLLEGANVAGVLVLGDVQYEGGELAKFRASYARSWGRFRDITYPVPGNHEYRTRGASGYFSYFGDRAGDRGRGYYSFDIAGWHFVALNSNCAAVGGCARGSPQERWLRADLAASEARCTLAFWHHPRFSSGGHGSDRRTDALFRTLYAAGADVVLSGHDHDYERFAPQDPDGRADPGRGIRVFVVGTGGKNTTPFLALRRNSEVRHSGSFGVLELTLKPAGYDFRFLATPEDSFTDRGEGTCH